MLINLSNHPSAKWSEKQIAAANRFGEIADLAFPDVSPLLSSEELDNLVDEYFEQIQVLSKGTHPSVHLMGEMTFTYRLVKKLKAHGIPCVASTTKRLVVEQTTGEKIVSFEFQQFREY